MRTTASMTLIAFLLILTLPACEEDKPQPVAAKTNAKKPEPPKVAAPAKMPDVIWRYWVFGGVAKNEAQIMTADTKEIRLGDLVVKVGPEKKKRYKSGRQELTSVLRELTCDNAEFSVRGTRFGGNTCGFTLNDDHTSGIYGQTMFDFTAPDTGEKLGTIMVMTGTE